MKQETKHMTFPSYINSWQTRCQGTPKYVGGIDLYSMKWNLEPLPIYTFFLLYPFNTDVNGIIWNTPHHWNVIIWCLTSLHDTPMMSCSFWWEFMHMHLVHWVDVFIQSIDAKADALILPSWSGETATPCAYHDIYIPKVEEVTGIWIWVVRDS